MCQSIYIKRNSLAVSTALVSHSLRVNYLWEAVSHRVAGACMIEELPAQDWRGTELSVCDMHVSESGNKA